jgi:hypothetical protein
MDNAFASSFVAAALRRLTRVNSGTGRRRFATLGPLAGFFQHRLGEIRLSVILSDKARAAQPLVGRVVGVNALGGGRPVVFTQKGSVLQLRTGGVFLNPHATILRIIMRRWPTPT